MNIKSWISLKKTVALCAALLAALLLSAQSITLRPIDAVIPAGFMCGFDASMVSQLEELGVTYMDEGYVPKDFFQILKDHGVNWVRLRIWNDPDYYLPGNNTYQRTLDMAQRIKAVGLNFLLDFHYSDTWADPAAQSRPEAWDEITKIGSPEETGTLCAAIYEYTKEVLTGLKDAGCAPDMVQIGNEINPGMLVTLSDGRTDAKPSCSSWKTNASPAYLTKTLKAAAQAVRETDTSIKVVIHLASSKGDNLTWWFDRMHGIDFDCIGLSYYPYYDHGTIKQLQSTIKTLKSKYKKDVFVVETSWGWSCEEWGDNTNNLFWYDEGVAANKNLVDSSNSMLNFLEREKHKGKKCVSASYQNQVTIFAAIAEATLKGGGCGVFYWGGDWVPDGNNEIADNWENQTLFDFEGVALPSLDMFKISGK